MRTFEEILADVNQASNISNSESLLRYAQELNNINTPQAEAAASRARGWAYHLQGDNSTALEYNHRALSLYEELGDRIGIAAMTGSIGVVHHNTGDYPAALDHLHRALALYEEIGKRGGWARVTFNIGKVYDNTGDYPSSLEHIHRALALFEELGDRKGVAVAMDTIGSVYHKTGDYPTALMHFHRALALHEELGNRTGVAGVTGNISNVYASIGDYSTALEHFHRALTLVEELGDRKAAAIITGNIGNVHLDSGDYPGALEHYHRALTVLEELGAHSNVANVRCGIVEAYIKIGSNADARTLLMDLDAMQIDDPRTRTDRDRNRADLQKLDGDLEGAVLTLQRALDEALEHGLRSQAADLHKTLRDLAQKRNDFAAYIEHNNEFLRITDEINGKDTATRLAMQEAERKMATERNQRQREQAILYSTLPKHIADRVIRGEQVTDHIDNASVIFVDIVGFTTLSSTLTSQQVATLLDSVFGICDKACTTNNITRIKTIGDSYLAIDH